jgi:hypothetical protein
MKAMQTLYFAKEGVSKINQEKLNFIKSEHGLEILEYGRRDPSRWPHLTLYPQKLALTSSTIGGRSV